MQMVKKEADDKEQLPDESGIAGSDTKEEEGKDREDPNLDRINNGLRAFRKGGISLQHGQSSFLSRIQALRDQMQDNPEEDSSSSSDDSSDFGEPGEKENEHNDWKSRERVVGNDAFVEFFKIYNEKSWTRDMHEAPPTMLLPSFSTPLPTTDPTETPRSNYLKACDRMQLHPEPMGIVKHKGGLSTLDLNSYSMGDNYSIALATGLTKSRSIESLNLSDNRLSSKGVHAILSAIGPVEEEAAAASAVSDDQEQTPASAWEKTKLEDAGEKQGVHAIKSLDLSRNQLQGTSATLASFLSYKGSMLESLDLQRCSIGDKEIEILTQAINMNQNNSIRIKRLNLGHNAVGMKGALHLQALLTFNKTITHLSLAWMQLWGEAAIAVANGLKENSTLVCLDLNSNTFGSHYNSSATICLGEALQHNETLTHLDLSHNCIQRASCLLLGDLLLLNHTLFGIHMAGNDGHMDPCGFMSPLPTGAQQSHLDSTADIINWNDPAAVHNCSECWLCGKWSEQTFHFDANTADPEWRYPSRLLRQAKDRGYYPYVVFLNLAIDDYRPQAMKCESPGIFFCTRMVPPGSIKYFFTKLGLEQEGSPLPSSCGRTVKKGPGMLHRQSTATRMFHRPSAPTDQSDKPTGTGPPSKKETAKVCLLTTV
jgi:Ran GTPase-activating protein (RanGAP) involved in mRNA processing and transport